MEHLSIFLYCQIQKYLYKIHEIEHKNELFHILIRFFLSQILKIDFKNLKMFVFEYGFMSRYSKFIKYLNSLNKLIIKRKKTAPDDENLSVQI